MAVEVKLPELGENLEGGDVLDVKIAPGSTVRKGQTLVEIEAEKATVEVPSPTSGRIVKVVVKKGEAIKVGQVICTIEVHDGQAAAAPPAETPAPKPEAPAPAAPVPQAERLPPEEKPPRPPAPAHADGLKGPTVPSAAAGQPIPAGPATRRLARELGVELAQVTGSGPGGRIVAEDVKEFVRRLSGREPSASAALQAPPLPDFEKWGPVERRPLDSIRRRTAEQMSLAWRLIPHVTHHDQADITDLDAFRRAGQNGGVKLTITAFALKAAAIALKEFTQFNASLDAAAAQLVLKRYCHIGVAVQTEHGLLVPVIRDVDRKSVRELAQALAALAERARQRKLAADELRGGTFTITNLGGFGGAAFSPIINYPEVAILGLSRARLLPWVHDGQIAPRLILPLCVSYDHRVLDGADAARFTRRVADLLERPMLMLLEA